MDISKIKTLIDESKGFETLLGMEFLSTPEDDTCLARMAVDKRTAQPFGFLSGGASVALAETLAGVASCSRLIRRSTSAVPSRSWTPIIPV